VLSGRNQWNHIGGNWRNKQLLEGQAAAIGFRSYGMIVARVLRGALKLRYLVLGGAVGGGMTLNTVSIVIMQQQE